MAYDGIDYEAGAEEVYQELTQVALGVAQILTDMGSSNASRASDTVEATQAALSLLGDRLYDAAWDARERERDLARAREAAAAAVPEG